MISALVIEDYPATQACVRRALLDMFDYDVHVHVIANADDAICILRSIRFDVVVSDYDLGSTCGARVLEYLRAEQPGQVSRFIFFTGSPQEARAIHGKVIDKGDADQFALRLGDLLSDVQIPKPERRKL